ncbi:unnamed protein product, partial [Vitis vinifera]
MRRLGGGGLSLEAFANAKSTTNNYNPALIKKQKEFYKNAKYVSKYKKSLKQQGKQNDISSAIRQPQDENEGEGVSQRSKKNKKKKDSSHSLKELYEKKREEEERTRIERDAIFQAKKEKRERRVDSKQPTADCGVRWPHTSQPEEERPVKDSNRKFAQLNWKPCDEVLLLNPTF